MPASDLPWFFVVKLACSSITHLGLSFMCVVTVIMCHAAPHCAFLCCRSGYSKHPNKQPWVLARVTGEPASAEPLQAITPANPPEAVVAAQVQAFRCAACGASESVLCWLASRQVPWK